MSQVVRKKIPRKSSRDWLGHLFWLPGSLAGPITFAEICQVGPSEFHRDDFVNQCILALNLVW